MEDILKYKQLKKHNKIENFDLNVTEEEIEEDFRPLTFKESSYITIKYKYNWRYHLNEIFNRMLCQEQNKPSREEIDTIKSKLNNNFTKENIYEKLNYNQRKHLIYIYFTLNGLETPYVTKEINHMKEVIKMHMNHFFNNYRGKAIEYRIIIKVICQHYNYTFLLNLLYYKHSKSNKITEDLVKSIIFPSN